MRELPTWASSFGEWSRVEDRCVLMFQEKVQKLFEACMKPKDEFTQWCENTLRGMHSSVDSKYLAT